MSIDGVLTFELKNYEEFNSREQKWFLRTFPCVSKPNLVELKWISKGRPAINQLVFFLNESHASLENQHKIKTGLTSFQLMGFKCKQKLFFFGGIFLG